MPAAQGTSSSSKRAGGGSEDSKKGKAAKRARRGELDEDPKTFLDGPTGREAVFKKVGPDPGGRGLSTCQFLLC